MKLATIRLDDRTVAVRVDADDAVELGVPDVGAVLARDDWHEWAAAKDGTRHPPDTLDFAPLVPGPGKIVCVGLNYRSHILETGQEIPQHPTLFAKFRESLIGANDHIILPAVSDQVDFEAELAVIIGSRVRFAGELEALAAIAGFAVLNDVSVRDYQFRTLQWLQGKTFEATTPLGPYLVTTDEFDVVGATISCEVASQQMQHAVVSDLVFGPAALVSYVSTIVTLEPGDVIATGTPSGVGLVRTPPRFLTDGDTVVTRIDGLGEQRNVCREEDRPK